MVAGRLLVVRRVRTHIEKWDSSGLDEQEDVFGRRKVSGAPLGGTEEFDPVTPADEPRNAHIILANPRRAGSERERILRRGYNYTDGLLPDGRLDAGLFFAAFQRDPRQFIAIQQRLAAHDRLNEYIVHTTSRRVTPTAHCGQLACCRLPSQMRTLVTADLEFLDHRL